MGGTLAESPAFGQPQESVGRPGYPSCDLTRRCVGARVLLVDRQRRSPETRRCGGVPASFDVNGDGFDDVLLKERGNGAVGVWFIAGGQFEGSVVICGAGSDFLLS
jgi:hypothetical protein